MVDVSNFSQANNNILSCRDKSFSFVPLVLNRQIKRHTNRVTFEDIYFVFCL